MRKKLLIVLFFAIFVITGCNNDSKVDIVDKLDKKISNMDKYQITGVLSITNNEDTYNYRWGYSKGIMFKNFFFDQ